MGQIIGEPSPQREASAVGVCFDMTNDDWIGSTHRGHGHCIAKGCEVEGMMLEIMDLEDAPRVRPAPDAPQLVFVLEEIWKLAEQTFSGKS
jgi:Dehydrogenase E1 component